MGVTFFGGAYKHIESWNNPAPLAVHLKVIY